MAIKLIKQGIRKRFKLAAANYLCVSSSLDNALPLEQSARAAISIIDSEDKATHYSIELSLADLTKLITQLEDTKQWLEQQYAKRASDASGYRICLDCGCKFKISYSDARLCDICDSRARDLAASTR